jgi:predicted PurR-regulated permease PerM
MSRSAKRFFIALMVGTMVALGFVFAKLFGALLIAAVLAVMLWPLQQWLSRKFRGRRSVAAAVLVFATIQLILAPLVGFSAVIVREATAGAKFVIDTVNRDGIEGLVKKLPGPLEGAGNWALERFPAEERLEQTVNEQGGKAVGAVGGVVGAAGNMLLHSALMLIALFFFLVEGRRCLEWIDEASPLRRGQTHELLNEVRLVAHSVVKSTFITAGVQAAAAMVGYLIARVPYPLFFMGVTFCCAVIPAIGAASVVLVASAILLLTGHPYFALFLALWGLLVVGLVDNLVKPWLIKGGAEMDGAVVFFSLIGGILAFGTVGLIIGPLVVALFLALLRMYHRDVAKTRRDLKQVSPIKREHKAVRPNSPGLAAD